MNKYGIDEATEAKLYDEAEEYSKTDEFELDKQDMQYKLQMEGKEIPNDEKLNEMVKEELVARGISAKKVFPFGLPLNISQINRLDPDEVILNRYKLKGNKKIYLFFGGSTSGSMYYYDYFKTLAKMNLNADVLFISGKNEKLKNKCEKYVKTVEIKSEKDEDNSAVKVYITKESQSVFDIAKALNVKPEVILEQNEVDDVFEVGQKVYVYSPIMFN